MVEYKVSRKKNCFIKEKCEVSLQFSVFQLYLLQTSNQTLKLQYPGIWYLSNRKVHLQSQKKIN